MHNHTLIIFFFFFNDTATTEIYTLSLHDALPIWKHEADVGRVASAGLAGQQAQRRQRIPAGSHAGEEHLDSLRRVNKDRKSTRLNSSHGYISYAVFCLKKKKKKNTNK